MKKLIIFVTIIAAVIALIITMSVQKTAVIKIGGFNMKVELANTPQQHQKGLSSRTSLDYDKGMLFVFENPIIPSFWMKDMNFSIDIIWIDEDFAIIDIEHSISPESFPETFSPPQSVSYVLEVNAGWARRAGLTIYQKFLLYPEQ